MCLPMRSMKNNLFYRAYLWESILAIHKGVEIYPHHANAYERLAMLIIHYHLIIVIEDFRFSRILLSTMFSH